MRIRASVALLCCVAALLDAATSSHEDDQLVQLEGVDLGDLSQLLHSEADIQHLGRELRVQHRSQRKQEIKRAEKMMREGRAKNKLKAEKRIADAESDNNIKAQRRIKARARYKLLAEQNIKDMKRMVKGHVRNAMSNFMNDHASRERQNKKTGARGKEERRAKKTRALELRWDPAGAGKRERTAKKTRLFLKDVKKENAVMTGWSMPKDELVEVAQEEKEEAKPMSEIKTNARQREVPKPMQQKSKPNTIKYELMAKQAFEDAKKLQERADGLTRIPPKDSETDDLLRSF